MWSAKSKFLDRDSWISRQILWRDIILRPRIFKIDGSSSIHSSWNVDAFLGFSSRSNSWCFFLLPPLNRRWDYITLAFQHIRVLLGSFDLMRISWFGNISEKNSVILYITCILFCTVIWQYWIRMILNIYNVINIDNLIHHREKNISKKCIVKEEISQKCRKLFNYLILTFLYIL